MRHRRLTLWIIGTGLLLLLADSELLRADTGTAAAGLLLFVLTVLPGWLWLMRGMPHLPLWEAYAGAHLAYYWLPAGRDSSEMLDQAPEIRVTCLLAVSLFLLAGWLVQVMMLHWSRQRRRVAWAWGSMAVGDERQISWAWWALWGCALYSGATYYGLVLRIVPQPLMPHAAAIVRIGGTLGVFFLGLRMGREGFRRGHQVAFVGGLAAYCTFETLGGLMGTSVIMCGNAIFAYVLGARRLPFATMAAGLAVITFFNMGKHEWRAQYMDTFDSLSVTERLGDWVKFSWQAVEKRLAGTRDEQAKTALERTDLTSILVRVVADTPREVPYWEGRTYSEGLQVLVPRFINPNRPELHAVMREIGITYGFHINAEMSQGTNISIGPVAEAWLNRNWQALGLAGACYGLLFTIGTLVARDRQPEQVGFLVGVSFISFIVSALEHLSMTMLMTILQSLGITVAVLFVLSLFHRRVRAAKHASLPVLPGSITRLRAGLESRPD